MEVVGFGVSVVGHLGPATRKFV